MLQKDRPERAKDDLNSNCVIQKIQKEKQALARKPTFIHQQLTHILKTLKITI